MTRLLVAIPVKDPAAAKSRLSRHLDPEQRATLILRLLDQSLACLALTQDLGVRFDVALVTTSPRIEAVGREHDLHVIRDLGLGLSAAAASARAWAEAQEYDALCVLPADLADPQPADLATLLSEPATARITLCPAQDLGTNAFLMPLPNRIAFQYGQRSFERHHRDALLNGFEPHILRLDSLARDVDQVTDLAYLSDTVRLACNLDIHLD